jgi:hypothetical protein
MKTFRGEGRIMKDNPRRFVPKEAGMRKTLLPILILLCCALPAGAQEDTKAFLAEARKACADLRSAGLEAFSADVSLRFSQDQEMLQKKREIAFAYAWKKPDKEDFAMMKVPPEFREEVKGLLARMWRDVTVTPILDSILKGKNPKLATEEDRTVLTCALENYGLCRITFDTASKELKRFVIVKHEYDIRFGHEKRDGKFLRTFREVFRKGKREYRKSYEGFRPVNEFLLPTFYSFINREGKATSFKIRYLTVNGRQAEVGDITEQAKAAVDELRKNWKKWDELEKVNRLVKLGKLEHDAVAAAMAKYGLFDRSSLVKKTAARELGLLGRRNVVPVMLGSLKKNEDDLEVTIYTIWALGQIGDPRAIPELAKGWWSPREQRTGHKAAKMKVEALGNIRDKRSIDAILDQFYAVPDGDLGVVGENILRALKKLTGQDLGHSKRAWKNWWKKNRATHRFDKE